MRLTIRILAALLGLALGAGACAIVSTAPDLTCADWLLLPRDQRVTIAEQLAGAAPERLQRIRDEQHLPVGIERARIVDAVVGSLDKNCEFWPPRTRRLSEVMEAMYGVP